MKTKFVKTNVKHYCAKDKKRHISSELANRCSHCSIRRGKTAAVIEHLEVLYYYKRIMKGKPKQNGSGNKGTRANRGRGGCATPRSKGQGRNPKKK